MSTDQPADEPETMASSKRRKIDPTNTRPGLLFLAKFAGSCRRYDHMYTYMRSLVQLITPDKPLTSDERNCFATACSSHLKHRLDTYNLVAQVAANSSEGDQGRMEAANYYLLRNALEIRDLCMEFLGVIDMYLLPPTAGPPPSADDRVFYKVLKGNFLLCAANANRGMDKQNCTTAAIACFESARDDGKDLPASSSTILSLQYSTAVLYSKTHGQPHEGYKIAREAYNFATLELNYMEEPVTEETAAALQTLRDFLDAHKMYAS